MDDSTRGSQGEPLERLAGQLRQLRTERRLTMAALERRAGLGHTTVSHALNGRAVPTEMTVSALARALGVDPGDLLALRAQAEQAVSAKPAGVFERRYREYGSDAARRLWILGVRLQDIATERGLTTDDVRARVQGTWRDDDVEQYMAGKSLPDWAFVQEFAKVVARDKRHRVDIERQVRPAWEAAARGGSPSTSRQADGVVRRRVAAGIAATAILVTVIVILRVVLSASPSGTITRPPSGTGNVAAGKNLRVSGTAQDIPSGYRLDLFLQYVNSGNGIRYYIATNPNSAISLDNGHWAGSIYIGAPGPIIIRLVLLSPSEIAYVNSQVVYQDAGFPSVPGTVLASANYISEKPRSLS